MVKVLVRRSQSQVQNKPRKEDHFYVISILLKRYACVLCMPKHRFYRCPSIGSIDASIRSLDASTLRFHWIECPPCWYNEGLLVIVNKDELIKQMCYNNRSAVLFKPWNTYKHPCSINEGKSHLLNNV